jgi:hypothetical protein
MHSRFPIVAGSTLALVLAAGAHAQVACDPAGSDPIARPITDSASGFLFIYRGVDQPVLGPDELVRYKFYSNTGSGWVTPLLFRIPSPNRYEIVAIGQAAPIIGPGLYDRDFIPIVGSNVLLDGEEYTFGFVSGGLTASSATSATNTNPAAGSIAFSGYNIFTDLWSYAAPISAPTYSLGQAYGTGGQPLDSSGFAGRIYSFEFYPKCTCPGDLTGDGRLDSGDLSTFIAAFLAGQPLADITGDGQVDSGDLGSFINLFLAGC